MTNANQQVEVIARFEKCPWCGSTDWMMRRLGKEFVEGGLIDEGMDLGIGEIGGTIVDPRKPMLTASMRPGMFALRDMCIGCGRQVTVKIEKRPVPVGMAVNLPKAGGIS